MNVNSMQSIRVDEWNKYSDAVERGECIVGYRYQMELEAAHVVKIEKVETVGMAGVPYTMTLRNGHKDGAFGNYILGLIWLHRPLS